MAKNKKDKRLFLGIIIVLLLISLIVIGFFVKYTKEGLEEIYKIEVDNDIYYYDLKNFNDATYYNDYLYLLKEELSSNEVDTDITIYKAKIENDNINIIDKTEIKNQIDSWDAEFEGNIVKSNCDSCDDAHYYSLDGKVLGYIDLDEELAKQDNEKVATADYIHKLYNRIGNRGEAELLVEKSDKVYIYFPDKLQIYVMKK